MTEAFENTRDIIGFVGLVGVIAFIPIVGSLLMLAKQLLGFAPNFDIGRLVAGVYFCSIALFGYVMMAFSWAANEIKPEEQEAFFMSGLFLAIFLLLGVRILWLFKRS